MKPKQAVLESDNIIPAFPSIIIEINRIIGLPETDYKKLSSIIQKDPAISARILKIVNSAFYGMPSQVLSITDAVSILGFDIVHRIALTISVLNTINPKNTPEFNQLDLLKHLFFTANINRFLSVTHNMTKPSEAYTAGLLHDIGKFILYKMNAPHYKKITNRAKEKNMCFCKAEKEIKGLPSHSDLGAYAAKKWNFPNKLVEAIRYHHKSMDKLNDKDDIILLMTSNFIENNKESILNSQLDILQIPPYNQEPFKKIVLDIKTWLPQILNQSEKEFQTFTETLDEN